MSERSEIHHSEPASIIAIEYSITMGENDCPTVTNATVLISNYFADELDMNHAMQNIAGSHDCSTGVLSLAGSAPLAHETIDLNNMTYENTTTPTVNVFVNDDMGILSLSGSTFSIDEQSTLLIKSSTLNFKHSI